MEEEEEEEEEEEKKNDKSILLVKFILLNIVRGISSVIVLASTNFNTIDYSNIKK